MPKKTRRHRAPYEAGPLKRFMLVFGALFLCFGVLAGFWFLSSMGPKPVDYSTLDVGEAVPEEYLAWERQSIEYEARFEELLALREPTQEDLQVLADALNFQRQYVDKVPRAGQDARLRLTALDKRYQDVAARKPAAESRSLQLQAERAVNEGDSERGYELYMQAYELQKKS